jgi:HAD superfamily hydrolase (TIGR01509 family)
VSISQERHLVSPDEYEAWLFDLDGVITDTASVRAAAWKATFDEYLKEVSEREEKSCEPFEIDPDYYRSVDGKPRYAGVDSFLRSRGIAVLQAAGLQNLFEVRVDGNVAAAKKLAGKPSSDTYEEATRMLGSSPEQAVVIEDAISRVQAGRTGDFGLVIGVTRSDNPEVLRQNSTDIVVRDLAELSLV